MTIYEAIKKGMIDLKVKNIEEPKLKARILMQYILNKERQYILVHDNEELTKEQLEKYFLCIKKIASGIPLQHITNLQEFMKLNFYVDENVLIPRPDTETLVEEVIKISTKVRAKKILDLCTGSGAIAVSLAKYLENVQITAIDISNKALQVAIRNAKNNNVEEKITFIESDLFTDIAKEKYDIIVSNPPYIKSNVIPDLNEEVRKEPYIALDGGLDGLNFYKKIIKDGYEYLKYKGYLCLEIGYDQKEEVEQIIKNDGKYFNTYSKKDLYGNDRIIVTQLN